MVREDIYPSEPRVLDAARLRLRPMRVEDAEPVLSLYSDDAVLRYLARPKLNAIEEAHEFIERVHAAYEDGTNLQLAIERKGDDAFVGLCLLFRYHRTSRRAEMGYAIAPPHWSRGYATEALRALVAHAFGTMELNRLEADIDPRNQASARVLDRLGFKAEGVLRERWIVGGEVSDSRMYGLLRREWRAA